MAMKSPNVDREVSISIVRLVAMSFIITCHIFQTYGSELCNWFNVGVQVFLIISGYLYSKKQIDFASAFDVFRRQIKKIMLPYYIWLCVISIIYVLLYPSILSVFSFIKALLCCDVLVGQGHLWFIPYILFCYIITPYLQYVRNKIYKYEIIKSTSLLFLFLLSIFILCRLYRCYFAPEIFSCYIVGYFYRDISQKLTEKGVGVLAISSIIAITVISCISRMYIQYFSGLELSGVCASAFFYFKGYSHLLLGLSIFIILISIVKEHNKYSFLLSLSDKYSYYIYLVHGLFILSPLNLLHLTNYYSINILLSIICSVLCGILLSKVTARLSSYVR